MNYVIRKAALDDREAIENLIVESARKLSQEDYSGAQIEAAIKTVFGVDTSLILDGTYFVAESSGKPAKIRAFFIHPKFARMGIARAILSLCEIEAKAYGFRSLELMSTLPGIKLYRACGYEGAERVECEVGDGVVIEFMVMKKTLE